MTEHTDPEQPDPQHPQPDHDLRGSFVAVMLMGGFFILAWGGVFLIAMGRR